MAKAKDLVGNKDLSRVTWLRFTRQKDDFCVNVKMDPEDDTGTTTVAVGMEENEAIIKKVEPKNVMTATRVEEGRATGDFYLSGLDNRVFVGSNLKKERR
ncbi:hypothetical protein TREES_T100006601 [Tupaia chinensis]|uniref:Uncharacterized protein n=1 Tax=Tupaia chinensis TaxID=246437 RepID=L9KPL2_TUPCH|nr:hypothetical protein TREES_T100006601 [Tupaia chinensis]